MSGRIQTGKIEPIRALILNASGRPIVGLTDVSLGLERGSDGKFYDFNDDTFKASGWTARVQAMTGIVPSPQPTDTTGDTDGATGVITGMADTSDFKVGDYATVSAGFPDTNIAYRITAVTGSSIELDINSISVANVLVVLGYHYPGYEYDFDTSAITNPVADDRYFANVDTPSGSNAPLQGEVPVGGWADDIVTMRGTDGANQTTPPTAVQNREEMDSNSTQLASLISGMARALGLSYENSYQHTRVYTAGRLTSVKVDLYDSKANATTHDGTTGIVAKYTLTQTHTGNELDTQLMVQDS